MSGKRIIFSTSTPNDQGFRIPNDVIDFSRYVKNPVILEQHNWDKLPIGLMTDIQYENGEWTGVPVFNKVTEASKQYAEMWEKGFLTACSIGGFKTLKTTGRMLYDENNVKYPEPYKDEFGIATCSAFEIYEISMVTLPSNPDAVAKLNALAPKCFDEINLKAIETQITTLSTKIQNMETEAEKATRLTAEAEEQKKADQLKADKEAADKLAADKATADALETDKSKLPTPIKGIVEENDKKKSGLAGLFQGLADLLGMSDDKPKENKLLGAEPTPKDLPLTKPSSEVIFTTDPKLPGVPNKLESENAKKLAAAMKLANEKLAVALTAKEAADKPDATDDDKAEFASKAKEAQDAVEMCTKMESDMDDDGDALSAPKEKSTQKSNKVMLKTTEELKAEAVKLAPKPQLGNRVNIPAGTTLSKLNSTDEGKRLIDRVRNAPVEQKNFGEIAAYLTAMRNEPKFKQLFDKVRILQNVTETQANTYRQTTGLSGGFGVDQLIAKLQNGVVSAWDRRDNSMREVSTLTATDTFLASPDLFAVDFLDLAIFQLFPNNSWKDDIAIFGAQETENNTGIIWANITANPAVYMGNKPVVTDYQYTDSAVALNLTPYWLQPMLWTPLTMHQLRYDQMSTGWAQAFAVLGTFIDDNLIYTLASTVPHSSIVYSTGISQFATGTQQFTLNGNADDPNSFYYNPLFAGTLNQPTLNDVIRVEQIYNKQNFQLETEKPVAVIDPTTDSIISQTAQTQSLLTRWVGDGGKELQGFKHTRFHQRSRVIAFDPTTAQVKNPASAIPNSATSANLCFIPSQVGIGLGKLDVFMIQDPSQYGYRMSADVRMGIVPLRADFSGTALWAYGPQKIS